MAAGEVADGASVPWPAAGSALARSIAATLVAAVGFDVPASQPDAVFRCCRLCAAWPPDVWGQKSRQTGTRGPAVDPARPGKWILGW